MVERLDDYIDLDAIERQRKQAVDNIEMLISAFERLQKKAAESSKSIRPPGTQGNSKTTLPKATDELEQSNKGLEEEAALQKEIEAGQKRINALKAKAAQLASDQAAEEAKLREQNKQLKREIDLSVRSDLAKVGSIDAMKVELATLTDEYNSYTKAMRDSEAGMKKQSEINNLTQDLKDAEFALNNFTRNVGNYEQANQSVRQEMMSLRTEMAALAKAGEQDSEEFRQMNARLKELHQSISNYDDGVQSVRGEMMMLKNELVNLRLAGKANTEEFRLMEERLGNLTDTLADVSTRAKVLGSDEGVLEGVTMALGGMSGAFEAAQAASAMFGDGSEDIQKTMLKVQATIAMTNGLMAVAKTLNKDSASAVIVNAYAQKLYTMVVGTSTGALKAFKLALAGTGIGLIIIALGYLISHWEDVTNAISGFTREQKMANQVSKEASEASSSEIAKLEILRKALTDNMATRDQRNKAVREYNAIADAGNQLDEKSLDSTEKLNAAIDKQIELTFKRAQAKAYENLLGDKIKEQAEKELEFANKVQKIGGQNFFQAMLGNVVGMQSAGLAMLADDLGNLKMDADYLTNQVYKLNIDAGSAEDAKAKIDALKQTKRLEIENIQSSVTRAKELRKLQYEEDVKEAIGNEDLKKQLTIQYNKDISDITREYSQKTASAERETAQSLTDIRMSLLKDGIEKEQTFLITESNQKKQVLQDRLKYEKELSGSTRQNINNTIIAIDEKLKKDQEQLQLKYYQESSRIENDLLQISAERSKVIADDEKQSFDQRVFALADYEVKRIQVIQNAAALDIEAAGDNADKIRLINENAAQEIATLRKENIVTIQTLTTAEYAKTEKRALDHLSILANNENIALNDQYAKGLITKEDYEKKKLEISNKYAKKEIEAQLKILAMQLMASNLSLEQREEVQKKISDLHKQLSDLGLEDIEKQKERLKEIKSAAVELTKTTISSIVEIYNESQNKRLTQIDEQKSANEEAMNKELEQAGNNETLKNQIKEKYALRDKKLDKERRKIEHDKAVAAKATALFEIAMSTAVAIASQMKGLPLTLPLIIMIGAMGAVQAAAVASREVPKYAKGREDGPAEIAWVGEEGPEIIREQSGKAYWTPGKPTLTYLPARAEVIPHDEIESRLLIQEAFEGRPLTPVERMQLVKLSGGDQARMISEAFYDIESYDHSSASQLDEVELMSFIERAKQTINSERSNTKSFSWEQKGFRISDIIPALPNHNLINKVNNTQSQNINVNLRTLEARIDNLTEVVRNKRENHISITERGMQVMSKNGSSWTEYIDNQLKG